MNHDCDYFPCCECGLIKHAAVDPDDYVADARCTWCNTLAAEVNMDEIVPRFSPGGMFEALSIRGWSPRNTVNVRKFFRRYFACQNQRIEETSWRQ
jgi:hypothetical protein